MNGEMARNDREGEFEQPVHPVEVHRHCAKPGCSGEMVWASTAYNQGRNGYLHSCTVCCDEAYFVRHYPTVEHRPGIAVVRQQP